MHSLSLSLGLSAFLLTLCSDWFESQCEMSRQIKCERKTRDHTESVRCTFNKITLKPHISKTPTLQESISIGLFIIKVGNNVKLNWSIQIMPKSGKSPKSVDTQKWRYKVFTARKRDIQCFYAHAAGEISPNLIFLVKCDTDMLCV